MANMLITRKVIFQYIANRCTQPKVGISTEIMSIDVFVFRKYCGDNKHFGSACHLFGVKSSDIQNKHFIRINFNNL